MVLTKQQQAIVDINEGQHLVLAPPGTGKTELLVQRLAKAIQNGVDQQTMICLTFTNRAAKNMLDRVESEVGQHDVFIGNIHSFCNTFLREHNVIANDTSLLDQEDVVLLYGRSWQRTLVIFRTIRGEVSSTLLIYINTMYLKSRNYYSFQKHS